jgi:pimeloyl-ACP methyl ester carboxylesterase
MRQTFLSWLTDRIILEPSRHGIAVPHKQRELVPTAEGHLELWVHRAGAVREASDPDLYVLKFPGTASRAEDSTGLVESCWPELCVEIWAVNPPGYGGSSGRPSLRHIPSMASRALDALKAHASERPLLIAGGSLGCVSALYLAANDRVDGLLLQNPPALRETIDAQSGWWHFAWARSAIARQIPEVLNSIRNAAEARVPAVFLVAEQDRIVPARVQQQIIEAYAGPKQVLNRPGADHDTPLDEGDLQQLRSLAIWLKETIAN